VASGVWASEAQLSLARGGTGADLSGALKGSVIAFNADGTASAVHGTTDGYVLTVQADGTLAFESVPGTGDMTKSTYDSDSDGLIDTAAGGTEQDSSAWTGYVHVASGVWTKHKSNLNASAAPTANDDSANGFSVGSVWIDTTNDKAYICLDATATAAVWTETTAALASHTLDSTSHSDVASMTEAQGDILYYNGSNWINLSAGTSGYFLQTRGAGNDPVWASGAGESTHTLDSALHTDVAAVSEAQGQIWHYDGSQWDALTLGTDGQQLKSTGTDVAWEDDVASLTFVIDGGGSAISTGEKGHLEVPFACTILQATLLADQSGSIVVDIWKDTYANFPPTDADSITASAPPTISSAQKSQDSMLSGWTTSIAAGDILAFNVDSAATITRCTVALKVKKT